MNKSNAMIRMDIDKSCKDDNEDDGILVQLSLSSLSSIFGVRRLAVVVVVVVGNGAAVSK